VSRDLGRARVEHARRRTFPRHGGTTDPWFIPGVLVLGLGDSTWRGATARGEPACRGCAMADVACGARRRPSPDRQCIEVSVARVLDSRPRWDARAQGTNGCADVRLAIRCRSEPTEFLAAGTSGRRSPSRGGVRPRPLRSCVERRFDEANAARLGRGRSDRRQGRGTHAASNDCTGDPGPWSGRRPIRQPRRHLHPSQRAQQRLRPDADRG
jgi:hypothetical protein